MGATYTRRLFFSLAALAIFAGSASARPDDKPRKRKKKPKDDYYTNVDGVRVHRPEAASSRPAGASARCRDGTYSFSLHRQGTCSHHGGVAEWY